jgi:hypothetical protein
MQPQSIREIARDLLRQYRHNHQAEADNPVMAALQERDDQETDAIYGAKLTSRDREILAKWQIAR